jgi:hypothetical protein
LLYRLGVRRRYGLRGGYACLETRSTRANSCFSMLKR